MIFRFCKDQLIAVSYPNNVKMLKYNLPYMFYLYLPKIFACIFIPIIKYKTKGDSNDDNRIIKQYHINAVKESKNKMFLLISIISLLEVIQENGDLLLYYYEWRGKIQWLIEKKTGLIIFVPFLSYFILKIDLFNHHILALILGFIGAFIINACRFFLGFSIISDLPYHLLNAFFSFLLSLVFVLTKYVMTNFILVSPYKFLFYNGIFIIINSFIYMSFEYFIVENLPDDKNYGNYFVNNFLGIFTLLKGQEYKFYIYLSLIFIIMFFYYVISALTIYNFNLYLIIIVETCIPIDNDMIEVFYKEVLNDKKDLIKRRTISQCIGYIIIIISALILNEIIILNFLGLNKNIRSNISSRSNIDSESMILELEKNEEEFELEENNNNINDMDSDKKY